VKLTGKIRSFDKYSVLLENNQQEQLIFKHAISTVVSGRPGAFDSMRPDSKPLSAVPDMMAVGTAHR
jgi:host factor-I protein